MFLVPIITALWVSIKAGHEIYAITKYKNAGIFIDEDPGHTNQHYAVLIMYFIYGIMIPIQIFLGGFTFSVEWVPLNTFVDIALLYSIEHFAIEREGVKSGIDVIDLLKIRKCKKLKQKIKNTL